MKNLFCALTGGIAFATCITVGTVVLLPIIIQANILNDACVLIEQIKKIGEES